jgi:hypothetical protein
MRREFGRKRLIYISENESPARFGGQIHENSLYFPGYQGMLAAETSSRKTASSATPHAFGFGWLATLEARFEVQSVTKARTGFPWPLSSQLRVTHQNVSLEPALAFTQASSVL